MEELMSLASLVALTAGLTEVIKLAFPRLVKSKEKLSGNFLPAISIVIGIVLCQTAGYSVHNVVLGIFIGLSASGLWDVSDRYVIQPSVEVYKAIKK